MRRGFLLKWTGPGATLPTRTLAPGKHKIKVEVLSALVATDDLAGLASDAPSADWPPAKKRWTRTAEMDLVIYPRDAVIVGQTQEPPLDPVASGGLSLKQIIIRPKGHQAQAVLIFDLNQKLPVAVSFDVALHVGNQTIRCGELWAHKGLDGQSSGSGEQLTADLNPLPADTREAEVVLTPNPKPVESIATVDRIWGKPVVFSHVSLTRQDSQWQLQTTQPATFSAPPPTATRRAQSPSPAALPNFGSVIERMIQDNSQGYWALNLASGKVEASTPDQPLDSRAGSPEALRSAKVDLYRPIYANTGDTVIALDMRLVSVGPDGWKTSASEALTQLNNAAAVAVRESEVFINASNVYVFCTREGATGILEIIKTSIPVKIRYRLVQQPGAQPPTAMPAQPAAISPGREPPLIENARSPPATQPATRVVR